MMNERYTNPVNLPPTSAGWRIGADRGGYWDVVEE